MTQQQFTERYTFSIKTDKIGGGSFGTVYKAYDNVLDREVAIKVSEVKYVGAKEFSLLEEFKAIENIAANPFIANYEEVFRFESFQGIFDYGIMQYYPMGNLSSYLKNNTVIAEARESIVLNILEGIGFLHQNKVVHRDLKPSNILVVNRRGKIIPKITDFGLSKQASADVKGSRFTNSFAGGTLQYSSPEQIKGLPLKLNTDLWSFGAIAYEILTDKTLFEAEKTSTASAEWQNEITNKILHEDVSEKLNILNNKWETVASSCLKRNINERVQTVAEIEKILLNSLGEQFINNSDETPLEDFPEEDQSRFLSVAEMVSNWKDPKPEENHNKTLKNNDKTRLFETEEELLEPIKKPKIRNPIFQKIKTNKKYFKYTVIVIGISLATLSIIKLIPTEEELWENTKLANTLNGYESYLNKYPDGLWKKEAVAKLYDFANQNKTIETYNRLLKKYSNPEAQKELDTLIYIRNKKEYNNLISLGSKNFDNAVKRVLSNQFELAVNLYIKAKGQFKSAVNDYDINDKVAKTHLQEITKQVKEDISKQENDMKLNPSQKQLYKKNINTLSKVLR